MRTTFRFAALVAFIAIVALLALYGGVIGGLIGLQSPDPNGPYRPDLNGGLRGAYAGLVAGALVAVPLAALAARMVGRWARAISK